MKTNELKVSIISGIYNAEKYLKKCVDSMLRQSYKNIEIILVVNASNDLSKKIVLEYEKKNPSIVKGYYVDEKLGAGGSRRYGMQYATGDYICFVDCDDIIASNYVECLMQSALNEKTLPDIVICNFKKFNNEGKELYIRYFVKKDQALVQGVAPWGKMFRRKYMQEKELEIRNIPFGEDVIFSAELYLTQPVVVLCSNIGYMWRDNPRSTSHVELKGFPQFTIEKSKEYFDYMYEKYKEKNILSYFMFKYYVWYLLQSGRNVEPREMQCEYEKIFQYLDDKIPLWNSYKHAVYYIKGERFIVTFVLIVVRILKKLKLAKKFFVFYSQSSLGKLWPSL